ncbi:hypothetical protein [Jannaschia sp. W003]|uniref:hypothetical protein n=1 Tax=Jannaschia sp. W003 TaxID=2867012 RepID=UPI0021A3CC90|nr:hypothetical protein [Jannaschia sp. W003]UWQ21007.1 hypothetical protein K3554_13670 [Jannaschia sp. W003]
MTLDVTNRGEVAEAALPVDALAVRLRLPVGWDTEAGRWARLAEVLRASLAAVGARAGEALLDHEAVLEGRAPGGRLLTVPLAPVSEVVSLEVDGVPVGLEGAVRERDGARTRLCLARALVAGARVRLVVRAGRTAWSDVPASLWEAVLLEAEALEGGDPSDALKAAARRLVAPCRVLRLGRA